MVKALLAGLFLLMLSVAGESLKVVSTSNFSTFVSSSEATLVMFYAPWCGHCHRMMPELERAAESLSSKGVGVAKVDGTALVNSGLLFAFNVKGFPSIFHIPSSGVRKFKGRRTASELSEFALSTYTKVETLGFFESPYSVLGRAKVGVLRCTLPLLFSCLLPLVSSAPLTLSPLPSSSIHGLSITWQMLLASSGLVVLNIWEWARDRYSLPWAVFLCTLMGCGGIISLFGLTIYINELANMPARGARLHLD